MRIVSGLAFALVLMTACGGGDPAAPDVPPVVTLTAAGSTTISSGSSVQLSATFRDNRGNAVSNATYAWQTTDATIATVTATGLALGARAGTATITALSGGASASIAITVIPGAAARLVVTTQPVGGPSGALLATQPVVEVRDAADNLVTTANTSVQAVATSGTLTGTTLVNTQQGVARFTDLRLAGVVGARALIFTSGALANAQSSNFELTAGALATIGYAGIPPRLRSGIPSGPISGTTAIVAQLRDADGNSVPFAGRRVVVTATGGTGTTTVTGATAATDAQGRAVFTNLTVTGTAGTRTLLFRADSILNPASATLTLVGGVPTRVVIERDVPVTTEAVFAIAPAPQVRLVDSVGNFSPEAGVRVTATSAGATLTGATAVTDTAGRAIFSALGFATGVGTRRVQFAADGVTPALSRSVDVTTADLTAQPASILTSATSGDTTQRVLELATTTSAFTPFLLARDAQGQPMTTEGVRWFSRDPSRVTVNANGQLTGLFPGRTFVVAQASRTATIADSVLVFTPKNGTGPIIRATLPSYRIRTDTFSITFEIVPRDGRTLSAADIEIAWPGNRSNPFSPFNVTAYATLSTGVQASVSDFNQNIRLTWASATPVSGRVPLVRLRCTVNSRNVANQVVITVNQLLQGDLTDITSATSVYNPLVIIP